MTSLPSFLRPRRLASLAVTLLVVLLAVWAALRLWDRYELSPWTRDGRVRANVVQIAPDVSGLVTAVPVADNQTVAAGTLLFEVDRARFELALRQAQAQLAAQQVVLAQARREADRNTGLGNLISQEVREQTRSRAEQARAGVAQAQVAVEAARLNLDRALVKAPSSGTITNFDLRQGAYASAGHPVLALVDEHSLYVEGYFEETKLARIHVGDAVQVLPMGAAHPLSGRVESVAAGIADRDRSTSTNLLPSVNPSFNWVRLPQRVPVRVKLDPLPAGEHLVAGQTVTVQVVPGSAATGSSARNAGAGRPAASRLAAPQAHRGAQA
ncbi:efflux RND transporter periplasmic adaptor subunit [Roseateles depolymerans]|uniref:Secretion protein HlyD family protein n=1 Tax=Roseateles depolymerans TaxID=76731 RepID=A0A0U3LC53_9BURK|nr:HlyD family secretion protein [Roseateles depolymerans]ALV05647.1 Secretion protein HlyD family protein [Roseateles depolymerans]REG14333.1 RND family efflux transporter MFP subunit [Roseateles depolymerans]